MPEDLDREIAGWSKARERFLQEAFPKVYARMEANGTLATELEEKGIEAHEMFETIVHQIRQQARGKSYLEAVEILKHASVTASELVMHDVILVPPTQR